MLPHLIAYISVAVTFLAIEALWLGVIICKSHDLI